MTRERERRSPGKSVMLRLPGTPDDNPIVAKADRAKALFEQGDQLIRAGIGSYVEAGEVLLDLKPDAIAKFGPWSWGQFLNEKFPRRSQSTIELYMRLATRLRLMPDLRPVIADMVLNEADAFLRRERDRRFPKRGADAAAIANDFVDHMVAARDSLDQLRQMIGDQKLASYLRTDAPIPEPTLRWFREYWEAIKMPREWGKSLVPPDAEAIEAKAENDSRAERRAERTRSTESQSVEIRLTGRTSTKRGRLNGHNVNGPAK